MPKVILRKLIHINLLAQFKRSNPFIIVRIFIKYGSTYDTGFRCANIGFSFFSLLERRPVLNKDIVVEPVISVENGHKACHLRPVTDMIRSVSGLILTIHHIIGSFTHCGKTSQNQIMYTGYTLGSNSQRIL